MMSLGVFFAAVLVSLVFDSQERRHRLEKELEYDRLGWEMPPEKRKPTRSEAIVKVSLGVIFLVFGGMGLYAYWLIQAEGEKVNGQYFVAVLFTVGVALISAGAKALRDKKLK
jgi:hypothetical protein